MTKDFKNKKRPSGFMTNKPQVKKMFPNTDLCFDVKTLLLSDRKTKFGKEYPGVLMHDRPFHYTFMETLPPTAGKRNPHVFIGHYITITRRDDGSLRLNFRPLKKDDNFCVDSYAIGVCIELRKALAGLVGERRPRS